MNTPEKLRGGSQSELTKLKRLWQKPDFEPLRELWRQRFSSELTQAQIRTLLKNELQINLQWDRQLTQFRQWVDRQSQLNEMDNALNLCLRKTEKYPQARQAV
jgi:hypothetical protein